MMQTSTLLATVLAAFVAAAPQAAGPAGTPRDDDKKPAPQAPAAASEEYRVGPGDKLRIEVYKDPQLSQSVQVRPDGKITLPLAGDMDATGRTPILSGRRDTRKMRKIWTSWTRRGTPERARCGRSP